MKIKNFKKIHIKRGITYFWDPQHPARIHLYMLSSASISHQAFLLHLMQPCKEKYQTVRNKTSRSCCFLLASGLLVVNFKFCKIFWWDKIQTKVLHEYACYKSKNVNLKKEIICWIVFNQFWCKVANLLLKSNGPH